MSSTLPSPPQTRDGLLSGYAPPEGFYDEMVADDGTLRPAWRRFAGALSEIGDEELAHRRDQAVRLVHENGLMYNAFGDPRETARPWDIDPLPLLISAEEWKQVSDGLVQRARLLNLVLADIYGPQRLLQDGLLPAELVFAHPGFVRAFHGQRPPGDCFLHFYAADMARSPDGRWWIVADRTDAPLGAGYALENRIVLSRVLPDVIRECAVERLASFFIAMRETLRKLAPRRRENPRIVLLSQGPQSPNYFEDAYLSRYLGYTLVEAGDLAVRDDQVLLKTLGGLLPVDVVFRRLSDQQADPLELQSDATIGVPGLLGAVRAGNVAVANTLGSSLVESPAFMGFLPSLSKKLLGQELLMPSVATWWCGAKDGLDWTLAHLDTLVPRSAYRLRRVAPAILTSADRRDAEKLAAAINARPQQFAAQERVSRSTAPTWKDTGLSGAHVALRAYVMAAGNSYTVLPGGLLRVASAPDGLDLSILAGEGSKDCWVLATGPVRDVSLLKQAGQAIELRRSGAELPSRVADNLFWLGRQIERADATARLLRTVMSRLASETDARELPEVDALVRCLAAEGQLEPGYAVAEIRDQLPPLDEALPAAMFDASQGASLASNLAAMHRVASLVRDRISVDSWRIIHRIHGEFQYLSVRAGASLSDVLMMVNRMIIDLAAFGGLVDGSMTRTQGWRFLDIGRRMERGLKTIALVQNGMPCDEAPAPAVLEALLEAADSLMTYRSRYLANLQIAPVLDLLLTDETNPRALAYQLAALADHVENLPREGGQPLRGPEQRIMLTALNSVRMVDVEMLSEIARSGERTRLDRMLGRLVDQLPKISDLISHKYLVHAGTPRQLAESRGERRS